MPGWWVGWEGWWRGHYWARELRALGHEVRLMPAQYVKAYIKRNKHDAADAEAICEAVGRPTMRFVSVKTADQQAAVLLHRGRERNKLALAPLIRSRRKYWLPRLDIPPRRCLPPVEFCRGTRPSQAANSRPLRKPLGSTTVAAMAVAMIGPMPGTLARRWLTGLLLCQASSKATNADPWVIGLRQRRPSLVVAVALANKTARIAWAVMHRHENYQRVAAAA